MEEKKLTDDTEIVVKGLENWILHDSTAKQEDLVNALDLIKRLMSENERLTEELTNLDWYKMWHGKFKKEIDDLTLELETYRPTKLHGNGQCKCSNCNTISWTDFGFSRYKGQTLCDKCLKEIISKEENQAVKDTAKEILQRGKYCMPSGLREFIIERYGVEVE